MISKKLLFIILFSGIILFAAFIFKQKLPFVEYLFREKTISCLSYDDLVKLAIRSSPSKYLSFKLRKQLNNPYLVNKNQGIKNNKFNKPYLRLAQWNIERGFRVDSIKNILTKKIPLKNNELRDFADSDIITLNEIDVGMPRTNYKNVISEIADALNYNYAFSTEFIELAPIFYKQKVDPARFLGLHGNAIISKYPIVSARVIRLPECYKWYESEVSKKSPLEHGRRFGAKTIFNIDIFGEPRRGGRNALVANIKLPSSEIITIVSAHLEDKCYPSCRLKQMKYLLENLKYIKRPVVIAGDFNTTTTDTAPASVKKEIGKRIKDPHFIARQFALALIPGLQFGVGNIVSGIVGGALHYKDPTALSIPVLFPNQERELFLYLKDFKFGDGESFDFSGDMSSNGKSGFLANSNERQLKGFESTFRFEKPHGIGYFKLDWFFVKPKGKRFQPFNGQTLKLVNETFGNRISDHDPICVDLSF